MSELAQKLQAPFREDEYEWRVQSATKDEKKVNVLCYVTNRAIQNRLDDVVGPMGWQVKYSRGPEGGIIGAIGIRDTETGEWVWKEDGAVNTDIEAVKGGLSNASKRAASAWGIGRLLYNLDSNWVELKDRGKNYHKLKNGSYRYWDPPRLPDWAVSGRDEQPKTKPPAQPKTKSYQCLFCEELVSKLEPLKAPITLEQCMKVAFHLQVSDLVHDLCKDISLDPAVVTCGNPEQIPPEDAYWSVLRSVVDMTPKETVKAKATEALKRKAS